MILSKSCIKNRSRLWYILLFIVMTDIILRYCLHDDYWKNKKKITLNLLLASWNIFLYTRVIAIVSLIFALILARQTTTRFTDKLHVFLSSMDSAPNGGDPRTYKSKMKIYYACISLIFYSNHISRNSRWW
jgi:hypothetical protein